MQPASASELQPAISLLEKTPRLLETLLGPLRQIPELYRAHALHSRSEPFMKYSNLKP